MDEPQRLEVQHDAGRNTRLVLRGPVQLRPQVIDLDQANGHKGYHLHVEAGSDCRCQGVIGAQAEERAIYKSVNAGACAVKGAIVSVEVYDGTEERQHFVLARDLPAVEIRVLRDPGRRAAVWRTWSSRPERPELPDLYGCAQIGIAAEEFHLVLSPGWKRCWESEKQQNRQLRDDREPVGKCATSHAIPPSDAGFLASTEMGETDASCLDAGRPPRSGRDRE